MHRLFRGLGAGFLTVVGLLAVAPAAPAQTWVPSAGGTYAWNVDSNWSPGSFPNSATAIANYNINIVGDQTTDLNQQIDLNRLNIGDLTASGTPAAFNTITIAPGTAGSFQFSGTAATIASQGGVNTITAPVTLAGGLILTNANTAGALIMTGPVDLGANTLRSRFTTVEPPRACWHVRFAVCWHK